MNKANCTVFIEGLSKQTRERRNLRKQIAAKIPVPALHFEINGLKIQIIKTNEEGEKYEERPGINA
jgi:hypothetical protein